MLPHIREGIRALIRGDASIPPHERNILLRAIDNPTGARRPAEETIGRVVRIPEAARLLSVSVSRIYQLEKTGRLVPVYCGRSKAEGGRASGVTFASLDALMHEGEKERTAANA